MFYRVLFLVVLAVVNVASINLTYIVKKDDNAMYPSCVAEELERYEAIGWIYPIPEDIEKLPDISEYVALVTNRFA